MGKGLAQFRVFFRDRNYRDEIKRYLLLLLLPLVMCVVLFVGVQAVITQQIQGRAELQADHFYTQTSAMLREMQMVSDSLMRNGTFLGALSSDNAENVDGVALCALIYESMEESPYISHVYVISERLDQIYTDEVSYSYRALPTILHRIGAEYADIFPDAGIDTSYYTLNQTNLVPYYTAPVQSAGETVGTLVVTLRMMEFLRLFFSLDVDICTVFSDSFYISSYLYSITDPLFDWHNVQSVSRLLGDSLTCFYRDVGEYTYLIGILNREYNRPLSIIVHSFCIYAGFVLVGGLIYLSRVSRKRYLQLASLVDALPEKRAGDYSSSEIYDDIRKSLLDLRDQKNDARIIREARSLRNLLHGYSGGPVVREQINAAGLPHDAPGFYVAAFHIAGVLQMAPGVGKHEAFELAHVILRSTVTNLSAGKVEIRTLDDKGMLIVVFIAAREEDSCFGRTVEQISASTVSLIHENYNVAVQVTVSSFTADAGRLPEAFQETQRLRNFARSIDSDAPVILQEKLLSGGGRLLSGDFIRQEQILINTLLAGKYAVVPSMVDAILTEHVSPLRKDYSLARNRLVTIANILSEGVLMANLRGMSAEEEAERLREAGSVQGLCAGVERVFPRMEELSVDKENNDVVAKACAYIHAQYSDQNLNVTAICEAAGASVQRLTRMFQARFDMAVAEYMNAYRVRQVKELLQDRRLSVGKIAGMVGYNNTDTLTRNFRKLEGITPSEYRRLLPFE